MSKEKKMVFEVELFNRVIAAAKIKSLYKVASIVDKKPSQIYEWTEGKKIPKTSTTLEIAEKLGVVVEFPQIHKLL